MWCFPSRKGRYEWLFAPKHRFVLSRVEPRLQNKNSKDADCMVRTKNAPQFLPAHVLAQKLVGRFGIESYPAPSFHSTLFTCQCDDIVYFYTVQIKMLWQLSLTDCIFSQTGDTQVDYRSTYSGSCNLKEYI